MVMEIYYTYTKKYRGYRMKNLLIILFIVLQSCSAAQWKEMNEDAKYTRMVYSSSADLYSAQQYCIEKSERRLHEINLPITDNNTTELALQCLNKLGWY